MTSTDCPLKSPLCTANRRGGLVAFLLMLWLTPIASLRVLEWLDQVLSSFEVLSYLVEIIKLCL